MTSDTLNEKAEGVQQPDWMLRGFQEMIVDCGITKVQMVGSKFTWRKGRTEEKLDRCLATNTWKTLFPMTRVRTLPPLSSDHTPLWITLDGKCDKLHLRKHKFHFENIWLRDGNCRGVV
ncbi:hypothetical protein SLE2022_209750 [Rubroshorea leprosula]